MEIERILAGEYVCVQDPSTKVSVSTPNPNEFNESILIASEVKLSCQLSNGQCPEDCMINKLLAAITRNALLRQRRSSQT